MREDIGDRQELTVKVGLPPPRTFSDGRYVVARSLGEGGQKVVYLVHDGLLDRDCALSLIKSEAFTRDDLDRLLHEARAMARLNSPNIVTVHDIGYDGGTPYVLCEYLPGGDLRRALREASGALSIERAVTISREICNALSHAHERNLIHRDLKPGNIWLARDGAAKLGDFGLAMGADRAKIGDAGTLVGTAPYMPPEQALGQRADERSDLYGLGAILYEMVAGRPPFLGGDAIGIIAQHINTAPVDPSWHNQAVPRELNAIILRLLAKSPDERFQSAAALAEALAAVPLSAAAEDPVGVIRNPIDRLEGGIFVGRETEVRALRAGLDDMSSGRGRLELIVGEAGVGKTRLAEDVATYAGLRGMQVLWGRCYEGEGAPVFWPWVQAIRSYVYEHEPAVLLSEMGTGAADIARVVSEVHERLPHLPLPPDLEPDQARFRLFDSITTFLRTASKAQPLVLLLEDLHWADEPSLLLLRFLAREIRGSPLMVIGTYRDADVGRRHPLASTLADLAREPVAHRTALSGLTEQDVARFIAMTAGVQPAESLIRAVYRETEGNPFFVKEVVSLLAAEGRLEREQDVSSWRLALPDGVRAVVERRLEHLSAQCNAVLTIASVIGRDFALDALRRLADAGEEQLLDAIEEAVAARVITETPPPKSDAQIFGRYSFSHALVRETLYEGLTMARRLRMHRGIAEALEALYGSNIEAHVDELAYHFFEAARAGGDAGKAVLYATRAAERATQRLAFEEAETQCQRALASASTGAGVDTAHRGQLLRDLGRAQQLAGNPTAAKNTYEEACELARTIESPEALARAVLGLCELLGEMSEYMEDRVALLDEAKSSLGEADTVLASQIRAALARVLFSAPTRDRAEGLSLEAVDIARRVGDRGALAYALHSRHTILNRPELAPERLMIATELIDNARAIGNVELELHGHISRAADLFEIGAIDELDHEYAQHAHRIVESRQPLLVWYELAFRGMRAIFEGRFTDAETLITQTLGAGQKVESQSALQIFGVQMFALRWEQGRLLELEPVFRNLVEQTPAVPALRCALAFLYAELDRETECRDQFEHIARDNFQLPPDNGWLIGVALCAMVAAHLHDSPRAAALYELLAPSARLNVCAAGGVASIGAASRYLGMLDAVLGRWDQAEAHFDHALAQNERMRARPLVALTAYDQAVALLSADRPGDAAKAASQLSRAMVIAQEIGMPALVNKILALRERVA